MSEAILEQKQPSVDQATALAADKAAREAAVKKADSFFKADIKEAPKGTPNDLFKKMAEKLNQDTTQFQDRIDEEKEGKKKSEIETTATNEETGEKKTGFIKSLKQTNEQLAKEAAELKAKAEKIPEYEREIEELRSKIEDGGTKRELETLRKELEQSLKEKQEREEALMADLENMRKTNAFLSLPSDPVFKESYDAPILNGYNQIKMIIGEDASTIAEFTKAVSSYEASLSNPDQNERARQREISKQILNEIYETLSPMEQAKFNSTAYDVLGKVEKRSQALADWEITKRQADEEKSRRSQTAKSQVGKRWQDAFTQAKEALSNAVTYNEDIAKILASEKYDDDTTEDELIAEAALRENSNYAPEQITRVLMQGAKFKKAKAYSFALEKENAELKETIKKMRGSSTSNSTIGSSSSGKANESEERTPEALFAKFRNR
jgi:hypothetical protein